VKLDVGLLDSGAIHFRCKVRILRAGWMPGRTKNPGSPRYYLDGRDLRGRLGVSPKNY
jgi:hypothetical protein